MFPHCCESAFDTQLTWFNPLISSCNGVVKISCVHPFAERLRGWENIANTPQCGEKEKKNSVLFFDNHYISAFIRFTEECKKFFSLALFHYTTACTLFGMHGDWMVFIRNAAASAASRNSFHRLLFPNFLECHRIVATCSTTTAINCLVLEIGTGSIEWMARLDMLVANNIECKQSAVATTANT